MNHAIVATLCIVTPALGVPTITPLGILPGGTFSSGIGLNHDGSVIAGTSAITGGFSRMCRWPNPATPNNLGLLPGYRQSFGWAMSADGNTVIGYSERIVNDEFINRATRWTAAAGLVDLGLFQGFVQSEAFGVSADGSVIVGRCTTPAMDRAFHWTAAGGMQVIPGIDPAAQSVAWSISADGSTIVGTSTQFPHAGFRWTQATGAVALPGFPGGHVVSPELVSHDGSIIVGRADVSTVATHAFRWSQAQGLQDLGVVPGALHSASVGMDAAGVRIVGVDTFEFGPTVGTIWTPQTGRLWLGEYLLAQGVNMAGWTYISEALDVSDDGTAIVGLGVYQGSLRGFVVRGLTPTTTGCDPLDFNNDGVFPDSGDIVDLLSVFAGAPCPTPACNDLDFNNDGVFPSSEDVDAYLRVFAGGSC